MFGLFKRVKKVEPKIEVKEKPEIILRPKPPIMSFIGISRHGMLHWELFGKLRTDCYPEGIKDALHSPYSFFRDDTSPYTRVELYKFLANKFPIDPIKVTWPDGIITEYTDIYYFDKDKAVCWIRDECMKTKLGDEFE